MRDPDTHRVILNPDFHFQLVRLKGAGHTKPNSLCQAARREGSSIAAHST
jgi:hypothetical protein